MKRFLVLILLLIGGHSFAQLSNFKSLVGYEETQIKQALNGYNSFKEAYTQSGKTLYYTFTDFSVMYAIKANKKCSKAWIMFNSASQVSLMNKWFYDNGYTSKMDTRTGEYEWTKSISIPSNKQGESDDEFILTSIKIDETTFFFADKVATLLGY